MKRKNGPWTITATKPIYTNAWITVREDDVIRPDGTENIFSVVHMKPGVTMVPLDENMNTYLVKEFRYGIEREAFECITGGIDPGEKPLQAAKRELEEEAGLKGRDWHELGVVDPHTSAVVSPVNLFMVKNLTSVEPHQEVTESIELIRLPLSKVLEMADNGKITHAASIVALYKVARMLKL